MQSAARRQKKKSRRTAEVFLHVLFEAAAFLEIKAAVSFYLLKK